jgi:hypothetical protein
MTSKERMLTALTGTKPDRLPVTTHHVMPYFLDNTLHGIVIQEFFDEFGFDSIYWTSPHKSAPGSHDFPDPLQGTYGFLESHRVSSDSWRCFFEDAGINNGRKLTRYNFVTPSGTLTMVIEDAGYTAWVHEPLIKENAISRLSDFTLPPLTATLML